MPLANSPLAPFLEELNNRFNQWVEQDPRLIKFVEIIVAPSKKRNEKLKEYCFEIMAIQEKNSSFNDLLHNLNRNLILLNRNQSGASEKCKLSFQKILNFLKKKTDNFKKLTTLASSYFEGLEEDLLIVYMERYQLEHSSIIYAVEKFKNDYYENTAHRLNSVNSSEQISIKIRKLSVENFIETSKSLDKVIDKSIESTIRDFVLSFDGEYQYILHDLYPIENLGKGISTDSTAISINYHQTLKKLKHCIKSEIQSTSCEISQLEHTAILCYLIKINALMLFLEKAHGINNKEDLVISAVEWAEISLLFFNKRKITNPQLLKEFGSMYTLLARCIVDMFRVSNVTPNLHSEKLFFADAFISVSDNFFKKALPYDKSIEQNLLLNLCIRAKIPIINGEIETFLELANEILTTTKKLTICTNNVNFAVSSLYSIAFEAWQVRSCYNVALVFAEEMQRIEKQSSCSTKYLELETEINHVREKLTKEKDALLTAFNDEFTDLKIAFSYDLKGYHIFLPISLAGQRAHAISDVFPKVVIKVSEKRTDCSYFSSQIAIEHLLVTDIFSSEKFSGIRFMLTTLSSIDAILKEVKFLLESPLVTSESVLSSKLIELTCAKKNETTSVAITEKKDNQSFEAVLESSKNVIKQLPVKPASILAPALKGSENTLSSYSLSESINNNNSAQNINLLAMQQVSQPLVNMIYQKNANQKKSNKGKTNNNNRNTNNNKQKDNAMPPLLPTVNHEMHTLYGNDFGFKFSGEITPIYSSEFTQKKRSTCFFVRWKGIKELDIHRENEFKKMLNPHPDGVITVGPLNEEGWKFYGTSLLRAKLLKKGLACRTITAKVEEITEDNKVLFALGKAKKHEK